MKDVKFLEENGVDYKKGIEILGDLDTYNDMLDEFLDEIDEKKANIENYYRDNDMENYAICAHSVKSDAKYFGFDKLATIAYEHEMAGKENNEEKIKSDFSNFIDEIDRIVGVIKQYRGV